MATETIRQVPQNQQSPEERTSSEAPIRVAMITPTLGHCGAARWLVDLIRHMPESQVCWTGVAVDSHGGCDRRLVCEIPETVPVYTSGSPESRPAHAKPFAWDCVNDRTSKDFRGAVQRACRDAEVVITWGTPQQDHLLGDLPIPRILVSHTTHKEPKNRPITGITHLVAVSEVAWQSLAGRDGFDRLPRRVIHCGVDPDRCMPRLGRRQTRLNWAIQSEQPVVGFLGRQSPEKNPLAAARAVLGTDYCAVYQGLAVNEQDISQELLDWRDQHPEACIQFRRSHPFVGDFLAGIDVLMAAGHREGFGLSVLEAWLAGVPVVSTPVGVVPELEQRFGPMVVPCPMDPSNQDLAMAVKVALWREAEMLSRARAVVKRHFLIQQICQEWYRFLGAVIRPDGCTCPSSSPNPSPFQSESQSPPY